MIEKLDRFHDRAMASFIIDDVCGFTPADADTFQRFTSWVSDNGLKGECSAIFAYNRSTGGKAEPMDRGYSAQVARCAPFLDAYMEVMTHNYLYDFRADHIRADGPHEGVWLMQRASGADEYLDYFRNIALRAANAGFRYSGLTLPGCGCAPCVAMKKAMALRGVNATDFNPGVFAALLQMLKDGQLAGPVCGLFVGSGYQGPMDAAVMMESGRNAVYDVPPGIHGDTLGRWENETRYLDIDKYITADGAGGRLAELLDLRSPTLIYYGHWQGLRPDRGVGYSSFQEVANRLARLRRDELVWMRPTEIAAYRHTERHTALRPNAAARSFELSIPFEAIGPLSLRWRGSADVRLRSPEGALIEPWRKFPSEACAIFDITPATGTYHIEQ